MGWGGRTTRRARFEYLRTKYLHRKFVWERYSYTWASFLTTPKRVRTGRKWMIVSGPRLGTPRTQWPLDVTQLLIPPLFFSFLLVYPAGSGMPPHVAWLFPPYLAYKAAGYHSRRALVGFHKRSVLIRQKRPRDPRNTAFNRKVTGANWYYFRTGGYFPDWDVLGRHPNETDAGNGVPAGTTVWPVPLGYT